MARGSRRTPAEPAASTPVAAGTRSHTAGGGGGDGEGRPRRARLRAAADGSSPVAVLASDPEVTPSPPLRRARSGRHAAAQEAAATRRPKRIRRAVLAGEEQEQEQQAAGTEVVDGRRRSRRLHPAAAPATGMQTRSRSLGEKARAGSVDEGAEAKRADRVHQGTGKGSGAELHDSAAESGSDDSEEVEDSEALSVQDDDDDDSDSEEDSEEDSEAEDEDVEEHEDVTHQAHASASGSASDDDSESYDDDEDMEGQDDDADDDDDEDTSNLRHGVEELSLSTRPPSYLPVTKDGQLDRRYKIARDWMTAHGIDHVTSAVHPGTDIPVDIPMTKDGKPDTRFASTKKWLMAQGRFKKDGNRALTVDVSLHKGRRAKSIDAKPPQADIAESSESADEDDDTKEEPDVPHAKRASFWKTRAADHAFRTVLKSQRLQSIVMPPRAPVRCLTGFSVKDPVLDKFVHSDDHKPLTRRAAAEVASAPIKGASKALLDATKLVLEVGGELGEGGFGRVVQGKYDGRPVAVKSLHMALTKQDRHFFATEVRSLLRLNKHPNVVKILGYLLSPPRIVMELVELGSLHHLLYMEEDPEIEARMSLGATKKRILLGVVDAMIQLHEVGITHGDIKPHNVLVDKHYTAKLCDFGLAELRGKTATVTMDSGPGGTAGYMAPELGDLNVDMTSKCDVYSFGIMLNEVVAEVEPFAELQKRLAARKPAAMTLMLEHVRAGNRPRLAENATGALKSLITKCWHADAEKRPTFVEIRAIMEQESFTIPDVIHDDE